ncbi:unnamed protein product [Penicillium roqueforti FM164]|uniref:Str. FM013 n=2 Tax=Penicillium TaxID=5073 RepID=A0A0G4PZA6_PENC3|nr:unnamed protein product [Penicillium roqueforti FM164]CRL31507.1 unnamed protein product [Penicillium camemberti]
MKKTVTVASDHGQNGQSSQSATALSDLIANSMICENHILAVSLSFQQSKKWFTILNAGF